MAAPRCGKTVSLGFFHALRPQTCTGIDPEYENSREGSLASNKGLPMSSQSRQTSPKNLAVGLSEQLASHLRRRLGGQASEFRVAIREGGLVLQGRARTHHAKQIALQAVVEITELPILANEIRVGPAAGQAEPGLAGSEVANPTGPPRTP